ncbi:MAG: NAD(P)-dependent oxidoreductase [Rhodospirillaceae bacterium]|nr:NAD(P)-dependent oxidoreductase [Rhodospirillaceae bacterium]
MATQGKPVAWVTGSAGFIGGNVARHLADNGWSVVGIDRRAAPPGIHVAGALSSATFAKALDVAGAPALVFHGAGGSSVGESVRDPAASQRDTVDATKELLDFLAANAPSTKVVFPSSAAIYGAADAVPLAEGRAPNPVSPYGRHKLAAEQLCLDAANRGLRIAVVRLFSVYGPGLRKQLPWELGLKVLAGGPHIELSGTGAETRDFLDVDDVAALTVFLANTPFATPLVVNGGTGVATRVDAFAEMLADSLGAQVRITFNGQARAGDPRHYQADITRLRALGFTPRTDLKAGLKRYAVWLKAEV